MAALTKAAVEQLWGVSLRGAPGSIFKRRFKLVLTGQGTVANPIPASILGFNQILSASEAVLENNSLSFRANPSSDGKTLLLLNNVDADVNKPFDVTGTVYITIEGR